MKVFKALLMVLALSLFGQAYSAAMGPEQLIREGEELVDNLQQVRTQLEARGGQMPINEAEQEEWVNRRNALINEERQNVDDLGQVIENLLPQLTEETARPLVDRIKALWAALGAAKQSQIFQTLDDEQRQLILKIQRD